MLVVDDGGDNYMITGRVPVLLNEERADLILVFDTDHPYGYIAGARFDYRDGETQTVAKALSALEPGDVIQPLAVGIRCFCFCLNLDSC